ncbi:hypothetical protein ACH5RR_034121 [Cinchona calisaya]|uniref:Protein kinase domain-containing protein n=1 Tax=Cinchona calisaya TaxID=153742 RepID=A0ABD2YEK4_9GENT
MEKMRKVFPFLRPKIREEEERLSFFNKNGSLLLEDLIASFGGRYKLPFRSFTAEEIIKATNNFSDRVRQTKLADMFAGYSQAYRVLVLLYKGLEDQDDSWRDRNAHNRIIRDIVMTSQLSHLKNILQLIGCSLEFEYPVIVYAYSPGTEFLADRLNHAIHDQDGKQVVISWRSRIKIASDISNVLLYLHTAFPTPIIYGNLTINKVAIDKFGVAKLFDFGLCISLPPGKLEAENQLRWADIHSDPQSFKSNIVTQKTDVYSLGVLMLVLLTGQTDTVMYHKGIQRLVHIRKYVEVSIESNHFYQIVDPKIIEEARNDDSVLEQQLLAFLDLAFRCTQPGRSNRPDMIDVAKELRQMEKSLRLR